MANKPADYSEQQFFFEMVRKPEAFTWNRPELILILLCPVAMRLAQRTNWPLVRECWRQAYGVHPLSEIRLEAKPCP